MNTKDKLLIIVVSVVVFGILINYSGLLFLKILALCAIILIFLHLKIKPHIHAINPKYMKTALKIDQILTQIYSFFAWVKPIKLRNNLFVDISQLIVIVLLSVILIL